MSENQEREGGALGFLDSAMRLFRGPRGAEPEPPQAESQPETLHAGLEAAIRELDRKIAEHKAATTRTTAGSGPRKASAEDRGEARQRRMEESHRAIRADIEAMHAKLGTGLASADLDRIASGLRDLDAACSPGRSSHELLPRARWAIGERLRAEAGELAVERLVALLRSQQMSWPDPTHYRPGALPEEIERSRTRRLRDVRAAFLAQHFEQAADSVVGVVRGWRSDYPDRGTPLWEETVLEAVAAAIRGQLLASFVEVLRRDREQLLAQTEESIGKELAAVQTVLAGGVDSIESANQAVASTLRVIDEVMPEVAWKHLEAQLPAARGEAG